MKNSFLLRAALRKVRFVLQGRKESTVVRGNELRKLQMNEKASCGRMKKTTAGGFWLVKNRSVGPFSLFEFLQQVVWLFKSVQAPAAFIVNS